MNNATTSCPDGHFAVGRRCFFIPKDGQKSWEDAQEACSEYGAFLAEPMDVNLFRSRIGEDSTHYGFWLGGSDRENEDIWKWEKHGTMIDQEESWYPGEPNNYGGAEDCLFLVKDRDPPLDDRPCDHLYYYICERT
ncbi:unnamed protein product [Meganyctiphanes norvegica]|uniref:C-type lectin domain-containing protein n=1 Tax=Meganyctiphanes norvegica TaxID=48144 RepID=A0AAV2QCQ0_MEGNR